MSGSWCPRAAGTLHQNAAQYCRHTETKQCKKIRQGSNSQPSSATNSAVVSINFLRSCTEHGGLASCGLRPLMVRWRLKTIPIARQEVNPAISGPTQGHERIVPVPFRPGLVLRRLDHQSLGQVPPGQFKTVTGPSAQSVSSLQSRSPKWPAETFGCLTRPEWTQWMGSVAGTGSRCYGTGGRAFRCGHRHRHRLRLWWLDMPRAAIGVMHPSAHADSRVAA